jgi:hypothetical protein
MPARHLDQMIGKKFTKLTVVAVSDKKRGKYHQVVCHCECGNTIDVIPRNLEIEHTKSCGCLRRENLEKAHKDPTFAGKRNLDIGHQRNREKRQRLVGMKSGKLTALRISKERHPNGNYQVDCECECGELTTVLLARFTSKKTKSCGCLQRQGIDVTPIHPIQPGETFLSRLETILGTEDS